MHSSNLDDLLLSSIESALISVFGPSTTSAVNFYVDKRIALNNPAAYSKSMRGLFGDASDVLLKKVIEAVSKGVGLQETGVSTLEECFAKARAKLQPPQG